jgi:hypothetical protein
LARRIISHKTWLSGRLIGLVLILGMFAILGRAFSSPSETSDSGSDRVIAVIYSRPGWWDRVGITYDHPAKPEEIRNDLKNLARISGWSPSDVTITNERSQPGGTVMSSVEFNARALNPVSHDLPIEPILLTFRRYKKVGIVVFVGKGYPYWGPLRYRNAQAQLQGEAGVGTFTFHLTIFDPKVSRFQYPLVDPTRPKPENAPTQRETPLTERLIMVIGFALSLAAISYGVASWYRNR